MDNNDYLVVKNSDGMDINIKVLDVVENDLGDTYLYYEIEEIDGKFISLIEDNGNDYILKEITPEEKEIVEKALIDNSTDEILGGN